jgi:lipoic acid synthetase
MNANRIAKPDWLKIKLGDIKNFKNVENLLQELNLKTVCKEANCPNRAECYSSGTATFLIMGSICTRKCKFCNVSDGEPTHLDPTEPKHIADAITALKLNYVVITSVTRDDLIDGGATHFAKVIDEIKKVRNEIKTEVLIPDLKGDKNSLEIVLNAKPEAYNLGTVSIL